VVDFELRVLGEFLASIPGQRLAQLFGQCADRGRESVLHRDRAVAGKSGPVLGPSDDAVAVLAWQVDQHREPSGALDQRPDRGTFQPDDQVSFPMARHRPVFGLGRALADHHLGRDMRPRFAFGPRAGNT